jgi:galactokinase/mevalonate kinase-like predicted kinase
MTVQASAPGRCGIIGNPSDIYGGVVVSCSVPARATCRLRVGGAGQELEDPTLWNAATKRFPLPASAVEWSTTVPASSGLAGSTALLAATLACVLAARNEPPDLDSADGRMAFAELLRDVERHDANVMCGYQDATMVVHGGLQRMDFAGKHPVEGGPWPRISPIDAPLPFLLITTGVKRLSGSVHGPIADRWLAGEPLVRDAIARISEIGREGADGLASQDWHGLAALMDENQRLTAEIGGSGDAIDGLIADCRRCGALSAKLAGAGMGGTVIALALEVDDLERGLRAAGYSQFMRPVVAPGLRFED